MSMVSIVSRPSSLRLRGTSTQLIEFITATKLDQVGKEDAALCNHNGLIIIRIINACCTCDSTLPHKCNRAISNHSSNSITESLHKLCLANYLHKPSASTSPALGLPGTPLGDTDINRLRISSALLASKDGELLGTDVNPVDCTVPAHGLTGAPTRMTPTADVSSRLN